MKFSQSNIVTHLRCGEIFNNQFIVSLLLSLMANFFKNRSTFGKVIGKNTGYCFFLTDGVFISLYKYIRVILDITLQKYALS